MCAARDVAPEVVAIAWHAAQEGGRSRGDAADSDANAPGGADDDVEGQLWEQRQELEELTAFTNKLQQQVPPPPRFRCGQLTSSCAHSRVKL